jgi:hypothetical protein
MPEVEPLKFAFSINRSQDWVVEYLSKLIDDLIELPVYLEPFDGPAAKAALPAIIAALRQGAKKINVEVKFE